MFSQLFGKYLVEQGALTQDTLRTILKEQASARVKLGTIAVAEGLLTEKQATEINYLQTQMDKRFGDIAVEKGYLTDNQVTYLLGKQGNSTMKFIQLLTEVGNVAIADLDRFFMEFQKAQGFNDEEMKALKDDDVDKLVPLFAFSAKPFVTDLAGLVLRNIMRFVTSDFYPGRLTKIKEYEYSVLAGQMIEGDHSIFLGFASKENQAGLLELASGYGKETFEI